MNIKYTFTLITLCTTISYTYTMDNNNQQEIIAYELTPIYTTRDYNQKELNTTRKPHNSDVVITINTLEHQRNTLDHLNHNNLHQNNPSILLQPIIQEKEIINDNNEDTPLKITIECNDINKNTSTIKTLKRLTHYGATACGIIIIFGALIGSITFAILNPCNYNATMHCLE